jgi:hypothetical protein
MPDDRPPSAPVAVVVAPVDAAQPEPDAAQVVASKAAAWDFDSESFGQLRPGLGGDRFKKQLGKPTSTTPPQNEAATGSYVTTWDWPGITMELYGESGKGPWTVRTVSISAPSALTTRRGIHVGSTRAEVLAAYPGTATHQDQYLVGTPYAGMLFFFDGNGKVTSMSLGAFAF